MVRHNGPPDVPRKLTLDARERGTRGKRDETVIPVTACTECMNIYEKIRINCPFCGHYPEPAGRASPKEVEGNLFELTPEALMKLRGESLEMQKSADQQLADWCGDKPPSQKQYMMHSQLKKKQTAASEIVDAINLWGAHSEANGDSRPESFKRFFYRFGMDVLTAQTLGQKESNELRDKINHDRIN